MRQLLISQGNRFRLFRHLILFVLMVLLFSWVVHSSGDEELDFLESILLVFIHAIFFFGYAYLVVYLFIPRILLKGMVIRFLLAFLFSGLFISLLKFMISDLVFYEAITPEGGSFGRSLSLSAMLVNTKDMSFIVVIFALVKYARDHYILKSNIRELQQRALEAEISLLEHQMDPHVIFNNFNNLYSISLYRPELLGETIKKLRFVLHYLFMDSKQEKVALDREISMLENYIGLESLRFGERLRIGYSKEGETTGLLISPLILYPFVENCFIHGAGEDPDRSWIDISVKTEGNRLYFHAANSRMPGRGIDQQEKKGGGENSLRRLELQYPNRHRLAIIDREDRHEVELNINL